MYYTCMYTYVLHVCRYVCGGHMYTCCLDFESNNEVVTYIRIYTVECPRKYQLASDSSEIEIGDLIQFRLSRVK